jgi:hypothetical protein
MQSNGLSRRATGAASYMREALFRLFPVVALGIVLTGCGHGPVKPELEPRALLGLACQPGMQVSSVKGSVWLKAVSKEASGQFPAMVDASSPEKLKMEVTNLVGGTEAIITVDGRHYRIEVPNHKERTEQGEQYWGGIPLQWANALFLGRIPCPDAGLSKDAVFSMSAQGELVVETPETLARLPEKYVYRFRQLDGHFWPEALHWERKGIAASAPIVVDFKFDDPETKTMSPKKWEAKGSQGEVKVRWRDRQVQMTR